MKRHAYLIMAHNQPELLNVLLENLDVPENDIYLHVDAKSELDIDGLKNIVEGGMIFISLQKLITNQNFLQKIWKIFQNY